LVVLVGVSGLVLGRNDHVGVDRKVERRNDIHHLNRGLHGRYTRYMEEGRRKEQNSRSVSSTAAPTAPASRTEPT
jgi:hypothetical protein